MKKVLQTLFLISFLAVLVVPTIILAAECPNCSTITVQCTCGANVLNAAGGLYCYNSTVYSSLSACQAAMGGTGTSQTGYQPIPTNVPSTPGELITLIDTIGNWFFTALLAIAVIFLVMAGFFFITAGGNPENVNKARQMLINALIGVAVGLAAKGLVMIIKGFILK